MKPLDITSPKQILLTVLLYSLTVATNLHAADDFNTVDVAYNGQSLFFDSIDPTTTKGAHFIYEGIIYRAGTLTNCDTWGDSCGWVVNAWGELEPEYPDEVIGYFTCSGFVMATEGWDEFFFALVGGDIAGAMTSLEELRGKPSVRVTQTYDFSGGAPGSNMVVTDGYELFALPGDSVARPVIGGSGRFKKAKGESKLIELTRVNASGGPSVIVEFPFDIWED